MKETVYIGMDVLLREGSLHWYGCVIEGGQFTLVWMCY